MHACPGAWTLIMVRGGRTRREKSDEAGCSQSTSTLFACNVRPMVLGGILIPSLWGPFWPPQHLSKKFGVRAFVLFAHTLTVRTKHRSSGDLMKHSHRHGSGSIPLITLCAVQSADRAAAARLTCSLLLLPGVAFLPCRRIDNNFGATARI
jgi:hypothetical protein